jgi:transposase
MSSITRQHVGKYTYLYESTSYRDEEKGPRNKKVAIGKIDPKTGITIYKQDYIDKMAAAGMPVSSIQLTENNLTEQINKENANDLLKTIVEVLDTVKDFGVLYFLETIAEKIGLLNALSHSIPYCWKELFMLACYLVASDKPVMYCEDWISSNDSMEISNMSSQRISELLKEFGYAERNAFYQAWYKHIREQEYIALDITSVSSYSKQISECEWGYNRDHEPLPQVNICMLFGEESKLPVYQTTYSGSLKDVSTLEATLNEFSALTRTTDIMIVMDKGFFSAKNINMLIGNNEKQGYKFLISMPFTNKFARTQVLNESQNIDQLANVILTNSAPIRGVHRLCTWNSRKAKKEETTKLHTHVFFNPERAVKERNELYAYVANLKKAAEENPEESQKKVAFQRYLNIPDRGKTTSGITIREEVVSKELEMTGWFVLVSNHLENTQKAHDVYRMKDVVEKGFLKYKNNLGLDRFRVHGDERMHNKTFVAFIALIISSHIYNVMKEKEMYKQMTFDKLIINLAKLKCATINGIKILRPMTKQQKEILNQFNIDYPIDLNQHSVG